MGGEGGHKVRQKKETLGTSEKEQEKQQLGIASVHPTSYRVCGVDTKHITKTVVRI